MSQYGDTRDHGYEATTADPRIEADRQSLRKAQAEGWGPTLKTYVRLSGPGWLQSAITLGSGSLAGSLYLGVIGGYEMMWFQPLIMILGVVMLSAIAYVALTTGEKPFHAINRHINPVLGWGWLIAAALANMVWAMPQFSIGTAAVQQNLLPGLLGGTGGKYTCVVVLFLVAGAIVWFYDRGGRGIKIFEWVIKAMVALIVLSFFGVVIALSVTGRLPWGRIFAGFVPDLSLLFEPSTELQRALAQTTNPDYWRELIMTSQRDRMAASAATAVGINMTFLLPYSMLRKGWDTNFRGLASFDLGTGLLIPFVLATSCVMIASAHQFHGEFDPGLINPDKQTALTKKLEPKFESKLDALLAHQGTLTDEVKQRQKRFEQRLGEKKDQIRSETGQQALQRQLRDDPSLGLGPSPKEELRRDLPLADRKMAARLISRDAFQFATSLNELFGGTTWAQTVFGIGVFGMAISTIIVLMLINGFCMTEAFALPFGGTAHRLGSLIPAATGALGFLFLWGDAQARFLLAVPTSVFGMALLPIAYLTFLFMMNSSALLGSHRPAGVRRWLLNAAMGLALFASGVGAGYAIWSKIQWYGVAMLVAFLLLALIFHVARQRAKKSGQS